MKNRIIIITISIPLLIFGSGLFWQAYPQIPAIERAALIDLYNSTNGDDWYDTRGWKEEPLAEDGFAMHGTEDSWWGIGVKGGHVVGIFLVYWDTRFGYDLGINLNGEIPSTISNLTGLKRLILYSNNISILPPEIGNISSLEIIDLTNNKLTSIPSEIGNLKNLYSLSLGGSFTSIPPEIGNLINLNTLTLTGYFTSIPPEVGNLTSLNTLTLTGSFTSVPPEIGNFTSLVKLDLDNSQLKIIPPEIGNLQALTRLQLSNNQITSIPPEIGNLTELDKLYLDNNQLTSIPSEIGGLTELESLRLNNNQLTSIPPELGNLTSLIWLFMDNNQLTSIPPELGNLLNLYSLYLEYNQLTSIPPGLGNLTGLVSLRLFNNQLTKLPPEIGKLIKLTSLYLSNNQLTSIPPEIGNLTNLLGLYLVGNQIEYLLPEIGKLSNLRALNLSNNKLTTIPSEIGALLQLNDLRLSGNQLVNIPPEIGNITGLEKLYLDNNQLTMLPPEIGYTNLWSRLYLNGNKLIGLPPEIGKLIRLNDSWSDFRWNALSGLSSELNSFLSVKQLNGDWQSTQTIAPINIFVGTPELTSVPLSWTAISYTDDTGGYEIYYSPNSGGPYTLSYTTEDKAVESFTVEGLIPCTNYYFISRTVTYPHQFNKNTVYSEYTDEVSAMTGAYTDTDDDGEIDCNDIDDDNDGISDIEDVFPTDPTESVDFDKDGVGDNQDTDDDNDGISDLEEQAGPNSGDSNKDGIPDSTQSNIANFESEDNMSYITLESPEGTNITDCQCSELPPDAPNDMVFNYGLFEFTVTGIATGCSTIVTLVLPDDQPDFDTYYRFGPTPDDLTPHWYEFIYDGEIGAEIDNENDIITLHFVDGERGDDDLTANGTIVDIGGPGRTVTSDDGNGATGDNGGGGGCFISTINE